MEETKWVTCDVVQDLMPSYVDDICSEDSKRLIERHIQDCASCQKKLDTLKNTTFTDGKTQEEQINYMKRVKQTYQNKSLAGFRLLAVFLSAAAFFLLYQRGAAWFSLHYIVLLLILAGTGSLFVQGVGEDRTNGKLSNIFVGIGIVGIAYLAVLLWRCHGWLQTARYPFGMEAVQLGPFLAKLLFADFVVQFAVFACCIMLPVRNIHVKNACAGLSVTVCCMAVSFYSMLKRFMGSDISLFIEQIWKNWLLLFIEGFAVIVVVVRMRRARLAKTGGN